MNCEPTDNSKEQESFETLEEQYYHEEHEYINADDGYYSGSVCDQI